MAKDTVQQTHLPHVGGRPVRWRRWLGGGLLGLIAALFLAWLGFPAWAPLLAQRLVPDNWSVTRLKLERPGFSGLAVRELEARGVEAGLPLRVTGRDIDVRFKGPGLDVGQLEVALSGSATPGAGAPFNPAEFSLPRLLLPDGLPAIRIDSLTLRDQRTPAGQQWLFTGLVIGTGGRGFDLQTTIDRPAPLATDLDLSVSLHGDQLQLRAVSHDQPHRLSLDFTQALDPSDPAQAIAELAWTLDLAMLDTTGLAQILAPGAAWVPNTLQGEISGQAIFAGTDRLQPVQAQLDLRNLLLASPGGQLAGDLTVQITRQQDTAVATVRALAIDAALRDDAQLLAAREGLAGMGVNGLVNSNDLELSLAGIDGDAAFSADITLKAPYPAAFSGKLDITAAQTGSFDLALTLHRLEGVAVPGDAPAVEELNLALDGRFGFSHPATLVDDDLQLGASSGAGAFTLNHDANRTADPWRATLTDLAFTGVSFARPGIAASMGQLSVSGVANQGQGLTFSGPVNGDNLVLASDGAPLAPPLLSARGFSLDLSVASAPGAGAATVLRGPLELQGVNLPLAAATADAVMLEMNPVSLPGLEGSLRILTTGLAAELDGQVRTGMDLDLSGTLREGRYYEGRGDLVLGYQASLPFTFAADLETTTGSVTLSQAVLPVAGLGALARPLGLTLPKNLGFDTGQLVLNGELGYGSDGISGALDLAGENLGLSLGESSLEGLDFNTQIDLAEVLSGGGTLSLSLARLAAGLDLVSLSSDLAISSSDEFGARSLQAQLLGGLISIPAIGLKAGHLQDAMIQWDGFDLGRLLEFVDVNGLDGTGIVDARFPLVAEPDGPAVREGSFAARGPGRLRYSSGVPAGNIGLQALEDFEYDSLSGTLDYGSDGAYKISIDLLGRNPDLYNGYPIRFRLNLGGSMPALFRSLFVTGDFDKAIIERLRSDEPQVEQDTP